MLRCLAHVSLVSLVVTFIYAKVFQPESRVHTHYCFQSSHMLGCPAHVSIVFSLIYAKYRVPWPISLST